MPGRLTALLLGLLLGAAAQAEPITLEQAVNQALQADPRIKERQHLVEAARALLGEAQGSDDWMVNSNAFVGLAPRVKGGFYTDERTTCTADCEPRSDVLDFDRVGPWASLQFSLIKPLYTFGKIESYSAAAQGNIEVKQGEVRVQRGKTVLDVSQAYYGYLAARDTRHLLEDVRTRLTGAIDLVEQWLAEDSGGARQSDSFALQAGRAIVDSYLAKAGAVEAVALDGLKVLTGVGLDQPLELADERIEPQPLPAESLEALQRQAMAQRPEMAQVEAGLRARRALVQAKEADQRPNVYAALVGSVAATPGRDQLNNPYVYDPFNHEALTPVLGIKWDFSSGVQPARVAGAQAELDALLQTAAFARVGIPFEVASAYQQVKAHHDMVQSLAEGSRAGRRWMVSSYADFEAGLEKGDKVVTAFQGYVLAHSGYLQAVFDYNMHLAKLRYVTGGSQ